MAYMKCPTCKELIGSRVLIYEDQVRRINDMNELTDKEKEEKKQEIVYKLFDPEFYCCKARLMTSVNMVELIK